MCSAGRRERAMRASTSRMPGVSEADEVTELCRGIEAGPLVVGAYGHPAGEFEHFGPSAFYWLKRAIER